MHLESGQLSDGEIRVMTAEKDSVDCQKVCDAIEDAIGSLEEKGIDLQYICVGLITIGVSRTFDIAPNNDAAQSMVLNILYDEAKARPSEPAEDVATDEFLGQNAPSTETLQ
jgi:hypothetical protein